MFSKTNLKLIFRNWKRNKIFSVISILSLVVGLACSNLLIAFVVSEWQISEGSPGKDQIFLVKSDNPMDIQNKEKTSFILPNLPILLKERYPEVESYCRFQDVSENAVFETNNFKSSKVLFVRADKNLPDFFSIHETLGNAQKTLSNPGEAAISASTAKLIYGETDVLGKSFSVRENGTESMYKITSVIDDSQTASFLKFDVLLPINLNTYFGGVTFVKFDQKASAWPVLERMKADGKILPKLTEECQYYLQPLTSVYFDTSETQSSWKFLMHRDKSFFYISILTAIAILIISSFNYINLYMVRIFKNEKNTGIQKILGAGKKQLQMQLFGETFLAVFTAFLFSFVLIILSVPVFNSLFDAHVSIGFLTDKTVLGSYFVLLFLLTIIPSSYLFLRIGKSSLTYVAPHPKTSLSNWTVALQFTISIILMAGAILYFKQLNFISETASIDKNMIEINGSGLSSSKLRTYKNDISGLTGIISGTISSTGFLNAWVMMGDDNVPVLSYSFDSDFLKVHNFKLRSGEGFSENEPADSKQVVVNETLVKKFGLKNPIGKQLPILNKELIIKGVIADFYTESFRKQVKPTIIHPFNFETNNELQTLQLQLSDSGLAPTLTEIKAKWEEYFPDKLFDYTFLSDEFDQLHSNDSKTAKIIGFFTMISIFLTAFGLFGMAWYSVEQRIKEIGIRKVNGAKIPEIIAMLNKDIVRWVTIAFVIATPVAYYAMHKWLQNFVYKTGLSWWIFVLGGLLTLGIALLTVSWQSWRAATRNPVEALRYE